MRWKSASRFKSKDRNRRQQSEYSLMVKFLSVIEAAAGSNPVVHVYLVLKHNFNKELLPTY